ncbi:hypothetical protein QOZ80_4AG0321960 [Eleusine coracana subsp. coracana]|nr:hypothetical protein QOZ80_4AG0321960 [Eleusine coracana subsp. coracana]
MEKIKNLFKGIRGNSYGFSPGKEVDNKTVNKCGEGTTKKTSHLMWTPFLQKKFLHALDLLGDAATPKKIEMLMNVNSIDRKQISAHLQVEGMPNNETKIIIKATQGNKVYEAMRRALQLGTVFDEQISNDTFVEEVINKVDSDQGGLVKLVTYSDSEDDEEVEVNEWF